MHLCIIYFVYLLLCRVGGRHRRSRSVAANITLVTLKNDDISVHGAALSNTSRYHRPTRPQRRQHGKLQLALSNWQSHRFDCRPADLSVSQPSRAISSLSYPVHRNTSAYRPRQRAIVSNTSHRRVWTTTTTTAEENMMTSSRHCAVVALSLYAMVLAASACKYTVDSYTTTDAMIVTEAAFIAQVSAECEDSPANLYAEVEGKLVVAANAGPNKYQVSWRPPYPPHALQMSLSRLQISWLDDFKKARRGDYNVNLYDEAGYGQLRKLMRDGESISSVTPVHSAYVRYSGAYRGVWVNSEFLAAIVSLVVLYFAYTFKSKIVS